MTVHGDDFLAVADLVQIKWIEEQLKGEYTRTGVEQGDQDPQQIDSVVRRQAGVRGGKQARRDNHRGMRGAKLESSQDPRRPGSRGGLNREGWS